MDTTLVALYRHNLWANLRLLDACADLDEETLGAGVAGTYGSVQETLVHILWNEENYVGLLTGDRPETSLRDLFQAEGFPGFDELRRRARRSGEALIELAGDDPHARELQGSFQGRPYTMSASIPLMQAIHHAHDHRSQIATALTQQGVEPPDLSAWTYNWSRPGKE